MGFLGELGLGGLASELTEERKQSEPGKPVKPGLASQIASDAKEEVAKRAREAAGSIFSDLLDDLTLSADKKSKKQEPVPSSKPTPQKKNPTDSPPKSRPVFTRQRLPDHPQPMLSSPAENEDDKKDNHSHGLGSLGVGLMVSVLGLTVKGIAATAGGVGKVVSKTGEIGLSLARNVNDRRRGLSRHDNYEAENEDPNTTIIDGDFTVQ